MTCRQFSMSRKEVKMRGLKTSVNIFKRAADGWYRVQREAHFIEESTQQKLRSCLERAEGSHPISIILGVTLTISTPPLCPKRKL